MTTIILRIVGIILLGPSLELRLATIGDRQNRAYVSRLNDSSSRLPAPAMFIRWIRTTRVALTSDRTPSRP